MTDDHRCRVLLADDHPMVRQGLRRFLLIQPDMELVAEAANGRQAVQEALRTRPDVVLMDLLMPEVDGITAIREIRAALPSTQVLALTSFANDQQVADALHAGAVGYLLKDISAQELAEAIRGAANGVRQLHPTAAKSLAGAPARAHADSHSPHPSFTERERAVLRELAAGRSNKEIAAALAISQATVKGHIVNILNKLGMEDRTQAAVYALRNGLAADGPRVP